MWAELQFTKDLLKKHHQEICEVRATCGDITTILREEMGRFIDTENDTQDASVDELLIHHPRDTMDSEPQLPNHEHIVSQPNGIQHHEPKLPSLTNISSNSYNLNENSTGTSNFSAEALVNSKTVQNTAFPQNVNKLGTSKGILWNQRQAQNTKSDVGSVGWDWTASERSKLKSLVQSAENLLHLVGTSSIVEERLNLMKSQLEDVSCLAKETAEGHSVDVLTLVTLDANKADKSAVHALRTNLENLENKVTNNEGEIKCISEKLGRLHALVVSFEAARQTLRQVAANVQSQLAQNSQESAAKLAAMDKSLIIQQRALQGLTNETRHRMHEHEESVRKSFATVSELVRVCEEEKINKSAFEPVRLALSELSRSVRQHLSPVRSSGTFSPPACLFCARPAELVDSPLDTVGMSSRKMQTALIQNHIDACVDEMPSSPHSALRLLTVHLGSPSVQKMAGMRTLRRGQSEVGLTEKDETTANYSVLDSITEAGDTTSNILLAASGGRVGGGLLRLPSAFSNNLDHPSVSQANASSFFGTVKIPSSHSTSSSLTKRPQTAVLPLASNVVQTTSLPHYYPVAGLPLLRLRPSSNATFSPSSNRRNSPPVTNRSPTKKRSDSPITTARPLSHNQLRVFSQTLLTSEVDPTSKTARRLIQMNIKAPSGGRRRLVASVSASSASNKNRRHELLSSNSKKQKLFGDTMKEALGGLLVKEDVSRDSTNAAEKGQLSSDAVSLN